MNCFVCNEPATVVYELEEGLVFDPGAYCSLHDPLFTVRTND